MLKVRRCGVWRCGGESEEVWCGNSWIGNDTPCVFST